MNKVLEQGKLENAARFLGSFTNRIDAKGRVSVPADFRKELEATSGVVCLPALTGHFLDCGGDELIATMMSLVSSLDYFDEGRDALEAFITSQARKLTFDSDGRLSLPNELRDHAGIADQAVFVGLGGRFQIWNPEAHAAKMELARKAIAENFDGIKARSLPSISNRRGRDE